MTDATRPAPAKWAGWSGSVLLGLLRSEYRKIVSTSAWWALGLPAALLCGLVGLLVAKTSGLGTSPLTSEVFALAEISTKFAVIFGVVCTTTEYQQRTISTSYLAAEGRAQLLAAKAVLASGIGAGYAVVCWVAWLLGTLAGGATLDTDTGTAVGIGAVSVVLLVLWAILGVGLGALLANQLAAITGVLMYLLLAEWLVAQFIEAASNLSGVQEYLPGGASTATLTDLADVGGLGDLLGGGQPSWWAHLLIFLGYSAAVLAAGLTASRARDIT